ncbi:MAG: hypothetical protein N2747_11060 [Chitinophagaceae bacterium]|nr:hypothetical protein [Chitinophagaceae bacterium]
MKLPHGLLTAWTVFMTVCCRAQADSVFRPVRMMKGDMVDFTVDHLDNIYILNSRNQIKKYNVNGDSVAVYNDIRRYGQATLIDVSNPLRVLLYYKDFATVVMLDRFLNVVNVVDFRKQGILQAKAIGQSFDNKIWIYDELECKLKKIDEQGRLIQETPDFRLILTPPFNPGKIFDENRNVYLYDSLRGVYVFDYFGTLQNGILIQRWKNFRVSGKYIFGSVNDTLYRYEIHTSLTDEWEMPAALKNSDVFSFTSTRMYALKKSCENKQACLYIYAFR